MNTALESAVVKARERLLSGALGEAQVSQGPVRSILHALGWDTFDVDRVVPEHAVGPRRVDYALKATSTTIDVFLEIKAPGKADDAADLQLFEYAFHQGVPFAVLTDGRVWNFYLPSGQGNYNDRRLFKLHIVERELAEACDRLTRYLCFDRVKKGVSRTEAIQEYNDRFQQNQAKELIPSVWQALLLEPDDLLCDALIEAVESTGGQRPPREDVIAFLRGLAPAIQTTKTLSSPSRSNLVTPIAATMPARSAPNGNQSVGFRIANGQWQSFSNGKQCYVAIIRHLFNSYPEFPLRFQSAKTRGKRAWIAKSKEALFPGRPDFQESEVTQIGGGWLVGTQMSAQVEMPKRVEAGCACVGLVFGRDIEAVFL